MKSKTTEKEKLDFYTECDLLTASIAYHRDQILEDLKEIRFFKRKVILFRYHNDNHRVK